MKLSKDTEQKLKTEVVKYLKKEGPSFDVPHTMAAVYWMKKLLEKEKGNEKILVPAMYLHDVGYYKLLKDNKSLEKRIKAKKRHMKRGARLAKKILKSIGGFSKDEIKEIARLVNTHDILDKERDTNEQLVFEAVKHAQAKNIDIVLIDTAGRMHSNENLMDEMEKIKRVAQPDLILFVGDALSGNDAVEQAKRFNEIVGIDGVVLTKVDTDAKGGSALSVAYTIGKPLLFIGVGQEYKDQIPFDPDWMIKQIFAS
jgi:23S rRNA pseudoU1915 N3-methylase RlmH